MRGRSVGDDGSRRRLTPAAAPASRRRAFAPEPARARLVHLLSGGCADRVRAVHRGLSDDAEMDPGRDRLCAVDRRLGRPDRADAGRRHRRCRALRTAGGGPCGRDHRRQRAGICGMADLSGRGRRGDAARRRELRARSGDCRDQPRSGRAARDRRAARTQRPLCVARQRRRRRRDGHLRLSAVEPLGVSRHLRSGDSDLAGAGADPRARNRCGAGAWRGDARGAGRQRHQRLQPDAPARAVDLRRQQCCCCNSPTRRCCR